MSKIQATVGVAEYPQEELADIATINYGGLAVSVTMTDAGSFLINLERTSDSRVEVEVVDDGTDTLWEGNLT